VLFVGGGVSAGAGFPGATVDPSGGGGAAEAACVEVLAGAWFTAADWVDVVSLADPDELAADELLVAVADVLLASAAPPDQSRAARSPGEARRYASSRA
jgi:hypothetical protein